MNFWSTKAYMQIWLCHNNQWVMGKVPTHTIHLRVAFCDVGRYEAWDFIPAFFVSAQVIDSENHTDNTHAFCLSRMTIRMHPTIPAMTSPISSRIVNDIAAPKPIIDQRTGIIRRYLGNVFDVHRKRPNVKIVVGHGRPKVGDCGYWCPKTCPRIG